MSQNKNEHSEDREQLAELSTLISDNKEAFEILKWYAIQDNGEKAMEFLCKKGVI